MASEHDRSRFIEPLPSQPSLQMQQKRAKNLLRAAISGHADARQRIEALHPKPPAPDALKLADTQLVVARGYGFESWAAHAAQDRFAHQDADRTVPERAPRRRCGAGARAARSARGGSRGDQRADRRLRRTPGEHGEEEPAGPRRAARVRRRPESEKRMVGGSFRHPRIGHHSGGSRSADRARRDR